jgi:hypothetical protein
MSLSSPSKLCNHRHRAYHVGHHHCCCCCCSPFQSLEELRWILHTLGVMVFLIILAHLFLWHARARPRRCRKWTRTRLLLSVTALGAVVYWSLQDHGLIPELQVSRVSFPFLFEERVWNSQVDFYSEFPVLSFKEIAFSPLRCPRTAGVKGESHTDVPYILLPSMVVGTCFSRLRKASHAQG